MDLISIIITLAVFGFIAWLILTYIPMPQPIKQIVVVIMVIVLILFLLQLIGIGPGIRIGNTG